MSSRCHHPFPGRQCARAPPITGVPQRFFFDQLRGSPSFRPTGERVPGVATPSEGSLPPPTTTSARDFFFGWAAEMSPHLARAGWRKRRSRATLSPWERAEKKVDNRPLPLGEGGPRSGG